MEWKQSTYNFTSFEYLNLIKNHHHNTFFLLLKKEGRFFGLLARLFVVIVGTLRISVVGFLLRNNGGRR